MHVLMWRSGRARRATVARTVSLDQMTDKLSLDLKCIPWDTAITFRPEWRAFCKTVFFTQYDHSSLGTSNRTVGGWTVSRHLCRPNAVRGRRTSGDIFLRKLVRHLQSFGERLVSWPILHVSLERGRMCCFEQLHIDHQSDTHQRCRRQDVERVDQIPCRVDERECTS